MTRNVLFAMVLALPLSAFGDGQGLPGPDAAKELDGVQNEIGRFEDAAKDFRGTVSHVVQQEYVQKRRALMQKYQGQLDSEEKDEKARRDSAIKLFEDFLARIPTTIAGRRTRCSAWPSSTSRSRTTST